MAGVAQGRRGARARRRRPPGGRGDRVRRDRQEGEGAPALQLLPGRPDRVGAGEGRHQVAQGLVGFRGSRRRSDARVVRPVGRPRADARHAAARPGRGEGARLPAGRRGRGAEGKGRSGPVVPAGFTSPLAEELADDLLQRFLRYVRIDTQSARGRTCSPSTPGQLDLSAMLVEELKAMALDDASLNSDGYVMATVAGPGPTIGLIAHVDTSPDAPGAGVEPIVHGDYDGGRI